MKNIVFYSKMFQSVHHLAEIQKQTGGVFVTNRHSTLNAFKQTHPTLQTAKYSKIPFAYGNRILKKADVFVTGSPYSDTVKKINGWKCMTFHGTYTWLTPKTVKDLHMFDHLFLIGPRMKEMLERHLDKPPFTYEVSGFIPFSSYPEKPLLSKSDLFAEFFSSPENPLIIYAPTSWKMGSMKDWALTIAASIPSGHNLIIRPHPRITLKREGKEQITLLKQLSELSAKKTTIALDLNQFRASDLYAHAALVISDANSTAEESLFYDCPQLLIETDKWAYDILLKQAAIDGIHNDDAQKIARIFDLGPRLTAKTKTQAERMICTALSEQNSYRKIRKEYFEWVFGSIRTEAAQKAAQTISSKIHE